MQSVASSRAKSSQRTAESGFCGSSCPVRNTTAELCARYATMRDRKKDRAAVEEILRTAVKARTYDEAEARMEAAGVGHTEVRDFPTVLDEPQARQPGKLKAVSFGNLDFEVPTLPFQYKIDHSAGDAPPPLLGEHTGEVMSSLGYTAEEIRNMMDEGAVSAPLNPIHWAPARRR